MQAESHQCTSKSLVSASQPHRSVWLTYFVRMVDSRSKVAVCHMEGNTLYLCGCRVCACWDRTCFSRIWKLSKTTWHSPKRPNNKMNKEDLPVRRDNVIIYSIYTHTSRIDCAGISRAAFLVNACWQGYFDIGSWWFMSSNVHTSMDWMSHITLRNISWASLPCWTGARIVQVQGALCK